MTAEIAAPVKRDGCRLGIWMTAFICIFQLGTLVMLLVTAVVLKKLNLELAGDAPLYIASDLSQLLAGSLLFFFFLRNRSRMQNIPVPKQGKTRQLLFTLPALFGWNLSVTAIDAFFRSFFHFSLSGVPETQTCSPFIMLVTAALFPAVAEELIFRGILYRYLRQHGIAFAAITSSLLFGMVHLNFLQLFFTFGMGLLLCSLYENTGTIGWGMLLHFLNNALSIVLSAEWSDAALCNRIQVVLGAIALPFLLVLLIRYCRKCEKQSFAQIRSFFATIPMLLFTALCLAFCIFMTEH